VKWLETMSTWLLVLLIGGFVTIWGVMIDVMMREFSDESDQQADGANDV
jgi:hypothetical protein